MNNDGKRINPETPKIISELETEIDFYSNYKDELLQEIKEKEDILNSMKLKYTELAQKYKKDFNLYEELSLDIQKLTNDINVIDYGIYKPIFNYDDIDSYRKELDSTVNAQKEMIKSNIAAVCTTSWIVDGSTSKGNLMTKNNIQLILRAFNSDCNAIMAKAKWDNYEILLERLKRIYRKLNLIGKSNLIEISSNFFDLKIKELSLICEYDLMKKVEIEKRKTEREERKEEEKALKLLERERKKAEEDEYYYQKAIKKVSLEIESSTGVKLEGLTEKINYLQDQLKQAQEIKERALSMAQQTKIGYVYVISNIGSFGEDVYKIGMTRRLDPNDRIRELSNASVPFKYDIHAMIYSDDAPSLEAKLHNVLDDNKLNKINSRKEFFKISLGEIENIVTKSGIDAQFIKHPEAFDYRESLKQNSTNDTLLESLQQKISSKYSSSLLDYEEIKEFEIE